MKTLSELAYELCLRIEGSGCWALLTECSSLASNLRRKLIEFEETRELDPEEKAMIDSAWEKHKDSAPQFNKTFCSQCGREFGPGNHGFSHCENHNGMTGKL